MKRNKLYFAHMFTYSDRNF